MMEDLGNTKLDCVEAAVRKRRTQASRRPKPDSQSYAEGHNHSPLSASLPSDDVGKASSNENACINPRRKVVNVNQFVNRVYSGSGAEAAKVSVRNKQDAEFREFYNKECGRSSIISKRSSEGVLAPANWKSSKKLELMGLESRDENVHVGRNGESHGLEQSREIVDALGNDSKVKKVKLKVGGVTGTIQANSTTNGVSSSKKTPSSGTLNSEQKQNLQGNLEGNLFVSRKRPGLQGIPWKDFARGGFTLGKEDSSMGRTPVNNISVRQGNKSEPVRKSQRVPKRCAVDEEFVEDYEDDGILYLEKLKAPKTTTEGYKDDDDESRQKQRKLSSVAKTGTVRLVNDGKKKSRSDRASVDADYAIEAELASDAALEGSKRKKQKKESVDLHMDGKREITLTTRQRALQSGKSAPGANLIEYPNGLPPAPPRKQKEKLSEMEQQLKKAEAAERRKLQNEKAARESEAEAIRKILGQDSSRKKREDKMKKHQEELSQEKAANAMKLASNRVRWVMGPTGTMVIFPTGMGLPTVFDSKPSSYPPPREKCAGPSCSNPYKYRDSKSKLPLCSLKCYKAVQEETQAETCC